MSAECDLFMKGLCCYTTPGNTLAIFAVSFKCLTIAIPPVWRPATAVPTDYRTWLQSELLHFEPKVLLGKDVSIWQHEDDEHSLPNPEKTHTISSNQKYLILKIVG